MIRENYKKGDSGWQKFETKKIMNLEEFKNEKGFEQIAKELGILELNRKNYQPLEGGLQVD